jgi:hypothetical protein
MTLHVEPHSIGSPLVPTRQISSRPSPKHEGKHSKKILVNAQGSLQGPSSKPVSKSMSEYLQKPSSSTSKSSLQSFSSQPRIKSELPPNQSFNTSGTVVDISNRMMPLATGFRPIDDPLGGPVRPLPSVTLAGGKKRLGMGRVPDGFGLQVTKKQKLE